MLYSLPPVLRPLPFFFFSSLPPPFSLLPLPLLPPPPLASSPATRSRFMPLFPWRCVVREAGIHSSSWRRRFSLRRLFFRRNDDADAELVDLLHEGNHVEASEAPGQRSAGECISELSPILVVGTLGSYVERTVEQIKPSQSRVVSHPPRDSWLTTKN